MRKFDHIAASSIKEVEAILSKATSKKSVRVVAGGTDLLGALKDQIHAESPTNLVDLKTIIGLSYVKEDKMGLRIGALTTLSEIIKHKAIREKYNLLAMAARTVASPQIRNMGTIGGNICQEPRCWYLRAPNNQFNCLRKGGTKCHAQLGENRYHSIFGGVRVAAPSCTYTCPGKVEIAAYMSHVRNGELEKAAEVILASNPMPALTGRVCPHFCESTCNRRDFDEPVSIREMERFVGDYILDHVDQFMKPTKQTNKKVAIVGSGPGGLSAAFYLRRLGYGVTVFDKMPKAGGMLTYCIPGNRLQKDVVERQIRALEKMGIRFELNTDIGPDGSALRNLKKNFNSVFLATGAWQQKTLKIAKAELLTSGMDFLVAMEQNKKHSPGDRVLVIGGGNVAIDVAISALRLGAKEVTMACLENSDLMPAFPEGIFAALHEGVKIMPCWGPSKVLTSSDGKLSGMEFVGCVKVFDEAGRFNPSFDQTKKMTINADRVILAIGQGADLSYAEKSLKIDRGLIVVNKDTMATNISGVFAGGDVTSGPASVIDAIAAGRKAAKAIDLYLTGKKSRMPRKERLDLGVFLEAHSGCYEKCFRTEATDQSSNKSLDTEDRHTIDASHVPAEVVRCMNCGCIAVNASDMAPALIALNAKIKTTKRVIKAEEFFSTYQLLEQDEIVKEIAIPSQKKAFRQNYLKFRIRNAIDFPIVSLASVLDLNKGKFVGAKMVLGAVAPIPLRIKEVEKFLKGKTASATVAAQAGELAVKNAKPLAKNRYKMQIVKALIKKAILESNDNT